MNERKHMFLISYRDPKTFVPVKKQVRLKFIGDCEEIRVYFDTTKFVRFITKDKNWTVTLDRARSYALKLIIPNTSFPAKVSVTYGWGK